MIKRIVSVCLVAVFTLNISLSVYANPAAVPLYVYDAIWSVALANGTRLGEENKDKYCEEIYDGMSEEEKEQLEEDLDFLFFADRPDLLVESALYCSALTLPTFISVSNAISRFFNGELSTGGASINDPIESRLPTGLTPDSLCSYLDSFFPYHFSTSDFALFKSNFSKFRSVYFFECETAGNYSIKSNAVIVFGNYSDFLNDICTHSLDRNGNLRYALPSASSYFCSDCVLSSNYNKTYSLLSFTNGQSDGYYHSFYGLVAPFNMAQLGGLQSITLSEEDVYGPLQTENGLKKFLEMADGTLIELAEDNILTTADYPQKLEKVLEDEGYIYEPLNGERQIFLKPAEQILASDEDEITVPFLRQEELPATLLDYDTIQKTIPLEPELELDLDLDTTDVLSILKSFLTNFWTNVKKISIYVGSYILYILQLLFVPQPNYIIGKITDVYREFQDILPYDKYFGYLTIMQHEIPDITINDVTYVNNQFIRDNINIIRELLQSFILILYCTFVAKSAINAFGHVCNEGYRAYDDPFHIGVSGKGRIRF